MRPMEQNQVDKNIPMHIQPANIWQGYQEYSMEKRYSLQ